MKAQPGAWSTVWRCGRGGVGVAMRARVCVYVCPRRWSNLPRVSSIPYLALGVLLCPSPPTLSIRRHSSPDAHIEYKL